jgi:hypothetical protein
MSIAGLVALLAIHARTVAQFAAFIGSLTCIKQMADYIGQHEKSRPYVR